MLLPNKYNINEFVLLFFNSVLNYLAVVALNRPIFSRHIEENIKIIKTMMHNPKQSVDFMYRAKNNLIISEAGFQHDSDQTLYNMFYDMLDLMNKYYFAKTDEQRFKIQYDMEQLYYSWCYEISSKNCVETNKYHIKQILGETRMKFYNLAHSLIH